MKHQVSEDRVSIISAGISYYCLLSAFPAIGMLVMLYGLIGDPATVRQQIAGLSDVMPREVYSILAGQLEAVSAAGGGGLGAGLATAFVLAAWSA